MNEDIIILLRLASLEKKKKDRGLGFSVRTYYAKWKWSRNKFDFPIIELDLLKVSFVVVGLIDEFNFIN